MEYNLLFDEKRQEKMRDFFLNNMAVHGVVRIYKKDEMIALKELGKFVAIVQKGKVRLSMVSDEGIEKSLYILISGEIFGEVGYLGGGSEITIAHFMEYSQISIISEDKLEKFIAQNHDSYKYLSHSIVRKYRISTMQMADMVFNDAIGRIANILIRLYYQQGKKVDKGYLIDLSLTHENIAQLIGCARGTVTKGINLLKHKNIIDVIQKRIIILNMEELKKYIKFSI